MFVGQCFQHFSQACRDISEQLFYFAIRRGFFVDYQFSDKASEWLMSVVRLSQKKCADTKVLLTQRAEEYTSDEIDAARELNHTQNLSVSVCKAKDRKTLTWKQ